MLLAAATVAFVLIRNESPAARPWPRFLLLLLLATVVWSSVMTIASVNAEISLLSLMTVLAAAMLFAATYNGAQRTSWWLLLVAFAPAVVNGVFLILQRLAIFSPFDYTNLGAHRMAAIGFLGNANDAATYLVYPCLAAAALAIASPKHRWLAAAVALITAAGITATETIGSLASLAAGFAALVWLVSRKAFVILAIAGVIGGAALFAVAPGRVAELREDLVTARTGNFDPLLSARVPGLLAAWHLFVKKPLAGHGLGSFPAQYFTAKLELDEKHPQLMGLHGVNYAEAHNEYLQLLAEGGVPALAIFLAALWLLATRSRGVKSAVDVRQRFAKLYAFPLATGIAFTSMAQFPMRLAAPLATALYLAAIAFAWSEEPEVVAAPAEEHAGD